MKTENINAYDLAKQIIAEGKTNRGYKLAVKLIKTTDIFSDIQEPDFGDFSKQQDIEEKFLTDLQALDKPTRREMLSQFAEFNARQVMNKEATYTEAHQNFNDVSEMPTKKLTSIYNSFFN